MPELYYCIAAYNEEKFLSRCLNSLAAQEIKCSVETVICLNGCTDRTMESAIESKEKLKNLNIRIVRSEKGLVSAQNTIVNAIERKDIPLVFLDADVSLHPHCIRILDEEMKASEKLLAVGGWPIPTMPEVRSIWQTIVFHILYVRALYPQSEIACSDVSQFKQLALTHPQPTVTQDFEVKSKIYFHGRIFMLRNAKMFFIPPDNNLADDTFLPNYLHYKYGPGCIRTRYDAIANYQPYASLWQHFHSYRRIFLQKIYLDEHYSEFASIRILEATKLDWRFIRSLGSFTCLRFLIYRTIILFENILFHLLPKREPASLWQYINK